MFNVLQIESVSVGGGFDQGIWSRFRACAGTRTSAAACVVDAPAFLSQLPLAIFLDHCRAADEYFPLHLAADSELGCIPEHRGLALTTLREKLVKIRSGVGRRNRRPGENDRRCAFDWRGFWTNGIPDKGQSP